MSACTDDRPYSLDLVNAVSVFLLRVWLRDLILVLGAGSTTGGIHGQGE